MPFFGLSGQQPQLMPRRNLMDIPPIPQRKPDLAAQVRGRFKAIEPYDLAVVDSRDRGISQGRKLEFYAPEQENNPEPGKPTVEVFDPSFQDDALLDIIGADFLHYLGKVDPQVSHLRRQFRESMTPEQNAMDRRAYDKARSGELGPIERRSYEDWQDAHRLDQYIGSMMLPEGPNRQDWMSGMTPQQNQILDAIKRYLQTGVGE